MNNQNSSPRCYSYIRFSTIEQSKGDSENRQTNLAADYARKNNLILEETIIDGGVSAFKGKNRMKGELAKFLAKMRKGEIPKQSILLVENLDRLTRESPIDAFKFINEIIENDVSIVALFDNVTYSKESLKSDVWGLMSQLLTFARANDESVRKSDRGLANWSQKRSMIGEKILTKRAPAWLTVKNDKFVEVPSKSKTVKFIFDLYLKGRGTESIAKELNQRNIETFKSHNGWRKSYIVKILHNRAVIGEFQPHKMADGVRVPVGEPIKNYFPAVIEESVFYQTQEKSKLNTNKGGKTGVISNLFGAITYCGYCNAPMQLINKGNSSKTSKYLVCDSARRGRGCSLNSMRYDVFESSFFRYFKEIDFKSVMKSEHDADSEVSTTLNDKITAIRGKIADLEKKIEKTEEMLFENDDDLSAKRFRTIHSEFLREKNEQELILAENITMYNALLSNMNSSDEKQKNCVTLIDALNETTNPSNRVELRQRVRSEVRDIVSKIICYPQGAVYRIEDIEKYRNAEELKIVEEPEEIQAILRSQLDNDMQEMIKIQEGSKDRGYFTIIFRNGNYRRIKFTGEKDGYEILIDKIGNRLNWRMPGKQIQHIVHMDDNDGIQAEIELHKHLNPSMTAETEATMARELRATLSEIDDPSPATPKNAKRKTKKASTS